MKGIQKRIITIIENLSITIFSLDYEKTSRVDFDFIKTLR